jgi:hypothetical protein
VAIKVALVRNNIRKDGKLAAWIGCSLLFWGMVTIQNVVRLVAT